MPTDSITIDSIMTKIDIEIDLRLGIGLVVITRSTSHNPLQPSHTDFREYYQMSRQAACDVLEDCIHPLDWFAQEQGLLTPDFIRSSRQDQILQGAFIAAANLLDKLKVERPPQLQDAWRVSVRKQRKRISS